MIATHLRPAFAGLLPHAPILVPEVGGAQQVRCRLSVAACREFARRLCASDPRRLVLLSPHARRHAQALGIYAGGILQGDLHRFGAPRVAVRMPSDREFAAAVQHAGPAAGVEVRSLRDRELDHGAVVPLWFLAEAGWRGPTTVLSPPLLCGPARLARIGQLIAAAAASLGDGAALVASGDMTHRAEVGAPAGFDPRAVEFDHRMVDLLRRGDLSAIAAIDPELQQLAAEDASETTALVARAIGHRAHGNEVLGYEHPFGVGYLVAVLHDGEKEP